MKKYLLILMLLFIPLVSAGNNLNVSLTHRWSFDNINTVGNITDDLIGNINGNLTGGTISGRTGILNEAFLFDGINDRVQINTITSSLTATISYWVKENATTGTFEGHISLGGSEFWSVKSNADGHLEFFNGATGTSNALTWNNNQWYNVIMVMDNGNLEIFRDNINISNDNTVSINTVSTVTFASSNGQFLLGLMDEICMWDRVLTNEEIELVYNNTRDGSACNADTSIPNNPPVITNFSFINNTIFNTTPINFTLQGFDSDTTPLIINYTLYVDNINSDTKGKIINNNDNLKLFFDGFEGVLMWNSTGSGQINSSFQPAIFGNFSGFITAGSTFPPTGGMYHSISNITNGIIKLSFYLNIDEVSVGSVNIAAYLSNNTGTNSDGLAINWNSAGEIILQNSTGQSLGTIASYVSDDMVSGIFQANLTIDLNNQIANASVFNNRSGSTAIGSLINIPININLVNIVKMLDLASGDRMRGIFDNITIELLQSGGFNDTDFFLPQWQGGQNLTIQAEVSDIINITALNITLTVQTINITPPPPINITGNFSCQILSDVCVDGKFQCLLAIDGTGNEIQSRDAFDQSCRSINSNNFFFIGILYLIGFVLLWFGFRFNQLFVSLAGIMITFFASFTYMYLYPVLSIAVMMMLGGVTFVVAAWIAIKLEWIN